MADSLYDSFKEDFLNAEVDLIADDIRVILIDTADYTVDLAADNFLDDIPVAARVAVSGALTGKTDTDGVFDADNVTFTSVSGDSVEAIVLYKHTGTDATSNLICYLDSTSGLPFTPVGTDVNLNWDNGGNGIFAIAP